MDKECREALVALERKEENRKKREMDDRAVFEESLKRVKQASMRRPTLGRMLERLEVQNNGAS